ncbi:hypothetical protein [Arthrobacter caoxuetaonis]|uniref:Uncharacterized protein n=1 Tax=Arthrobacter caoxuetaonis TaxID=2886935 RepID=A0A9X1MGJ0_9MICC|nr:hypothetical protein [Arthrobacter caoxuetaonis]MCC3299648.1 hypothetical protein [Arthrobacter caoxuetaonis]USQ59010.1 hypothetical protein NF551_18055 [Arthrobacter caoxuetaonis]
MAVDFRLTEALKQSNSLQQVANRHARTANQIAYVNILLSLGVDVPQKLAEEVALGVGDEQKTLALAVPF